MTSSAPSDLHEPDFSEIQAAAGRLAGQAVRTPLVESPLLNDKLGFRLLVKPEALQRSGSFKLRGAYNKLASLDADTRQRGVVAYSSGNHAQGVALAARLFGVPALIVMPKDAPRIKIENTRAYGAEIVLYDRAADNREQIAREICATRGATIVPPYDDPAVISGQGTIGLEVIEQADEIKAKPDAVLVPCGGGGLVSGCAVAIAGRRPGLPVYSVEPAGFDDTARSLGSGKREKNSPEAKSFCDALLASMPGEITFALNRRLLAGGLSVDDREVARAMTTAFTYLKLVIEPGGAVALAAALAGKVKGDTLIAVCSGGNVDPDTFRHAMDLAA
jgi:threonine dehydratase